MYVCMYQLRYRYVYLSIYTWQSLRTATPNRVSVAANQICTEHTGKTHMYIYML